MKSFGSKKLALSVLLLAPFLILLGQRVGHAQGKKAPACNNDTICQNGELKSSVTAEAQPCSDCQPKTYGNLLVLQGPALQLVSRGAFGTGPYLYSRGRVFQYKTTATSQYTVAWASQDLGSTWTLASIGDADNDGSKEIVALGGFYDAAASQYNQKVFLFKTGSDGTPLQLINNQVGRSAVSARDLFIADVNNDGLNEIVFRNNKLISVYRMGPVGAEFVSSYAGFSETALLSITAGNTDNSSGDEIIVSPQCTGPGYVIILKYRSGSWTSEQTEPVAVFASKKTDLTIDYASAADADGDGVNEIISGGNNNRLMIWEYDAAALPYKYKKSFVSTALSSNATFTYGGDVGDIDADGRKEIVIASAAAYLFGFRFENGQYVKKYQTLTGGSVLGRPLLADVDFDGKAEIALGDSGVGACIYKLEGSAFAIKFNFVYGSDSVVIN